MIVAGMILGTLIVLIAGIGGAATAVVTTRPKTRR